MPMCSLPNLTARAFNMLLTIGKKDNTYKFALAKFPIDYSSALDNITIETFTDKAIG